ncbi:MAG: 5'/3'-nucleotidase SurE [Verrucomicrobiota bacterium]
MILLTNDDGVGAPGLELCRDFLAGQGEDVVVVAPAVCMSQCGHSVTTGRPLRVSELGNGRYSVEGTPADCVRVALVELLGGEEPEWVVSGLNHGANLGVDLYISGTVAAAREAVLHGVPAVAWSQYHRDGEGPERAWQARQLARVWEWHSGEELDAGAFWNVNLPHVDGEAEPVIVACEPSRKPLPLSFARYGGYYHYSGKFHEREGEAGSDVARCFDGAISVSMVRV